MKHLIIGTLAATGLLLTTMTASAQYYPRQDRREFEEREAREPNLVFNRVHSDLDRAQDSAPAFTADRTRVMRAREELNEAQRMVNSGQYDGREFDEAIAAVQRVAQFNRLSDYTRDNLMGDVRDLRRVQARFEG